MEPVLYFTWTPYWVSGALVPGKDVEWLTVPYTSLPDGATGNTKINGRNLGFAVDSLRVMARNDFLDANPAARKLFELASVDINDVSANALIAKGRDHRRHRQACGGLDGRPSGRIRWLAAARAAAN